MKKYSEYVNFLSENEDVLIPDDAILKTLYPELDYPGQRKQQWYQDTMSKKMRTKSEIEYTGRDIPAMQKDEVVILNSKITHMITRASATNNSEFIEEVMSLIESYPELLVGLKLGNEIATTTGRVIGGSGRELPLPGSGSGLQQ